VKRTEQRRLRPYIERELPHLTRRSCHAVKTVARDDGGPRSIARQYVRDLDWKRRPQPQPVIRRHGPTSKSRPCGRNGGAQNSFKRVVHNFDGWKQA